MIEAYVAGTPHLKHAALRAAGFEFEVIRYFSTQCRVFQPLRTAFGLEDTFGVIDCSR